MFLNILFAVLLLLGVALFWRTLKAARTPVDFDEPIKYPLVNIVGLLRGVGIFKIIPKEEYLTWKAGYDIVRHKRHLAFQIGTAMNESAIRRWVPFRKLWAYMLSLGQMLKYDDVALDRYINGYPGEHYVKEVWQDYKRFNDRIASSNSDRVELDTSWVRRHLRYCEGAILAAIGSRKYVDASIAVEVWLRLYVDARASIPGNDFVDALAYSKDLFPRFRKVVRASSFLGRRVTIGPSFFPMGTIYHGLRYTQNLVSVARDSLETAQRDEQLNLGSSASTVTIDETISNPVADAGAIGKVEVQDKSALVNILIKQHYFPVDLGRFLSSSVSLGNEPQSISSLFRCHGLELESAYGGNREACQSFLGMLRNAQTLLTKARTTG